MEENEIESERIELNKLTEKYKVAPVSINLSPDRQPKPIIQCKFSNYRNLQGWILVDTGATVSLVNKQSLTADNHVKVSRRLRNYYGAGGSQLPLGDYLVDVKVWIEPHGELVIKNAIVCEGKKSVNTILLGTPDIRRLGLVLDYNQNKMLFTRTNLQGVQLRMPTLKSLSATNSVFNNVESNRSNVVNEPISRIFEQMISMIDADGINCVDIDECDEVCEDIDECETAVNKIRKDEKARLGIGGFVNPPDDPDGILDTHESAENDRYSTIGILGDPCITNGNFESFCKGCDQCVDPELKEILLKGGDNPPSFNNPSIDQTTALLAYIERIRERDKNTFTHDKCTIDPEMEKKDPELAAAIRLLIQKHKRIFAKDIGRLGPEFKVRGYINEKAKMSIQRPGHSPFQDDMLVAVMKQFAKLLAHGVIRPIEDLQVEPKNVLMVLPVKKKDDDGNVLNILNALRLVVNSKPANKHTNFVGQPTDNLNDALNFAARTSKDGYNAKVDVSKAYFNIPLHESLYPYFCIDVPIIGRCHFTVIVQGWAPAAQICQDIFSKIFFTLKDFTKKYMDDFVLATPNCRLTYLNKLDQFFTICSRNNLRLSGDKAFFCTQKMNYLGVQIDHGKIKASDHYVLKLKSVKLQDITTKKKLKSFVASLRFLARFQHRSTEILKPLNDASSGEQNEKIEWTDDLIKSFNIALKALDELSELHPFDPALQTILVVDTSLVATGGFMYQISADGPKLVMFFSRTRRDKERKTPISSCHMEMLGLKSMVYAFIEMLRQCQMPVTIVTDSRAVVKVFEKYKKDNIPSADTVLNNALYAIVSVVNVNVIHANNTNTNIKFSDDMSRLGLFVSSQTCDNNPKCTICQAADPNFTDFNKILNAVTDNYRLGLDHGNILVNSIQDGIELPRDSIIFKIKDICNDRCCSLKAEFKNIKLKDLLENSNLIKELQLKDKSLSRLWRDINNNVVSYAKTDQKLQTMLRSKNAGIERNYICIDKIIDGMTYRVIPLPSKYGILAITAVHNSIGHSSAAQLYKHAVRYFQIEKLREKVKSFVSNCVKCTLLRGGVGYQRIDQKPVPIPKSLFTNILVDEVTRTFRGENIKFFLAMESVSNFIVCIVYKGSMTSALFMQMLCQVKVLLCPFIMDHVSMTVRCDRATWHTSSILKTSLSKMNIELQLYQSTTLSKNVIPELDARIKIFSIYLAQIVEDSPFDLTTCCHLATAKTNNSISKIGLSPAEVFVGRSWKDQEQIKINISSLLDKIKERRSERRHYEERRAAEKFLKSESKKIPYKNDELNSPLISNPKILKMKPGDLVTLKETVDKNNPRCSYEVIKIDFKNSKVLVKRVSHRDTKDSVDQWISFKLIHSVHTQSDLQFLESWDEIHDLSKMVFLANYDELPDSHHSLSEIKNIETGYVIDSMPILSIWEVNQDNN